MSVSALPHVRFSHYSLLRRLQKENCLITYDMPYQGRNRRYYSITEEGRLRLAFYRVEWGMYKEKVDSLLQDKPAGNSTGSRKGGIE